LGHLIVFVCLDEENNRIGELQYDLFNFAVAYFFGPPCMYSEPIHYICYGLCKTLDGQRCVKWPHNRKAHKNRTRTL